MKLVTFGWAQQVGYLDGEDIVVLETPSMRDLFEEGGADETGERIALADTELRAPILPTKLIHAVVPEQGESLHHDSSREVASWGVSLQNVDAIVGPDDPVVHPEHLTDELDCEPALAVVLRKGGRWFAPEEAMEYVGGYMVYNDVTARDIQRREIRTGVVGFCKAIETFSPLGPWIVTPDEVPDPHDLAMELRVNGEVRRTSHSGRTSATIPEILSRCSALGYSAGDVLSIGTVSAVAGPPDASLEPGDVMECEIERIGVLQNSVVSWETAYGAPGPPRVRW